MKLGWRKRILHRYFSGDSTNLDEIVRKSPVEHDKVVVHIPARSASKRIVNKNVYDLCGVPLLAYTIVLARELGADRVIINTDSKEYARIAERYGAEVPFIRPAELATDMSPPGYASFYAKMHLLQSGYPVGGWVEMFPTSPFRNLKHLRKYYRHFLKAGSLTSAVLPRVYSNKLDREKCVETPMEEDFTFENSSTFYKYTGTFLGNMLDLREIRCRQLAVINNPIELIDIDTLSDMKLAERIIDSGSYDFGTDIC